MSSSKILIVESRFYEDITDNLVDGAIAEIKAAGASYDRLVVPGILEIPAGILFAVQAAQQGVSERKYDGFVALGCAILGETDHYHHVCREAMNGIQNLVLEHSLCVGNGILAVHNFAQAMERCPPSKRNFGGQVTQAALRMIEVKREVGLLPK